MTTNTTKGIVTRNDVVAVVDGTAQAGILTWWELSGLVDVEVLRLAWQAAGLDITLVPEDVAPKSALRRAVETLAEQRKLVRPLAGREGYSLVEETAAGEKLDYKQAVVAMVDADGVLTI